MVTFQAEGNKNDLKRSSFRTSKPAFGRKSARVVHSEVRSPKIAYTSVSQEDRYLDPDVLTCIFPVRADDDLDDMIVRLQ